MTKDLMMYWSPDQQAACTGVHSSMGQNLLGSAPFWMRILTNSPWPKKAAQKSGLIPALLVRSSTEVQSVCIITHHVASLLALQQALNWDTEMKRNIPLSRILLAVEILPRHIAKWRRSEVDSESRLGSIIRIGPLCTTDIPKKYWELNYRLKNGKAKV